MEPKIIIIIAFAYLYGIIPDVTVQTTVADSIAGVDKILEKGLEIIKK